ncbi:MarR family transcriptional regulator [Phycicoccus endophyticus]|uniref:MarR family transcriptional regulator n=1 Tax=Phycicoccus endophyticus TaxID=1690220 RepID=A0A7G9QYV3_9MICO|nr:MarR family transcriptional regulator [Phycicoccus endophyticus]NHI20425.1 MarR family transcriptional regulator [Phycicoccus endophyticus]QNN48528.1 MarR family transcriptional regulator [Phycicoccus endophyticus]GGL30954.1 MarR family transcriptional regulator [Phycicoccus endophyticus]
MSPREATAGEVRWLEQDQLRDWRSLMSLVVALPTALDAQLKRDAGMNSFEYHVLAALSEAPGHTLALSELAHLSRGSLSRLSHAVTRLERDGWLTRSPCPGGQGRRVEARLTDAGMAKLRETAPGHVAEARRLVVDVLDAEELRALGSAARQVARAAGIDLESGQTPPGCPGTPC